MPPPRCILLERRRSNTWSVPAKAMLACQAGCQIAIRIHVSFPLIVENSAESTLCLQAPDITLLVRV